MSLGVQAMCPDQGSCASPPPQNPSYFSCTHYFEFHIMDFHLFGLGKKACCANGAPSRVSVDR